jgi:acyl-CoA thioesterase I
MWWKKVLVIILCIAIAVVGLWIYVHKQVYDLPVNNPDEFLNSGRNNTNKIKVMLIGASLIQASISHSIRDYLIGYDTQNRYEFINAGINGDLVYNAIKRIQPILDCKPDYISILIGSNDAMGSMSETSGMKYVGFKQLPQLPDFEFFRKNLHELLMLLKNSTNAKLVIHSLPPITENFEHELFIQAEKFSKEIKEIAEKLGVIYIGINEEMKEYLLANRVQNLKEEEDYMSLMYKAVFKHYVLRQSWDEITESIGNVLLVDNIHVNSKGAQIIAQNIQKYLLD